MENLSGFEGAKYAPVRAFLSRIQAHTRAGKPTAPVIDAQVKTALIEKKEMFVPMNSDEIQGKWKQLKGSVRQQFGRLTDEDLEMIAGQRDRLIGKLQERYGYLREEAQKKADEWLASAKVSGSAEQRGQPHMPPPSSQQPGSQQQPPKR